ncbi:MAG: protein-methionine-sulfoxide reductase catalytic subunit MsrP [Gammaproteobacteria bacterium]|nr:protein-methionine-sulfoxide reductase catalytic subunit MsrP [Gammaproteobacteria bacterium]MDP6167052.1 protein-methionine-sulfoxide reductase catalytic subunit MsrP [Gammaproteobacteria bacterium]
MPIKSSDITPEVLFRQRRRMLGIGLASLSLPLAGSWFGDTEELNNNIDNVTPGAIVQPELKATELKIINSYNNYYEFGFSKEAPSGAEKTLITSPWSVEVGGIGADKPGIYDIAELHGEYGIENHIRRFRCVEAWSMVVPWNGIALAKVIKAAQPNSKAKYVRFETLHDEQQMPNANWAGGPYIEGLTIAEAIHPLAMLATGIYDKPLEQQTGAPVRLVVPWKYGFKYAKSIVRIDLVERMPRNTWWRQNPNEYGFYANVNPQFDHPRWSQATERVVGGFGRQKTLLFNGYADEVAYLYPDLGDRRYFY